MKAYERLKKARVQLQKQYPFFAYLSLYIKFGEEETKGRDTIGIDGNGNMVYNEAWIGNLSDEELQGVLTHEALHLAFLHMVRRGTRHPDIWNIADDLAINCILVANNFTLPKGLVPDNEGNFEFKELFNYTINCKDKPAEVIYDEIYSKIEKEMKKQGKSIGTGQPIELEISIGGDDGDDGTGKGKKGKTKLGNGELGKRFDVHIESVNGKKVSDMSAEEKAELEKTWIQRVTEAHTACALRGTMPLGVELLIGKLHEAKVNWRHRLTQVIQSYCASDFTYQRVNKKSISTGIFMPDFDKERIEISIAIDTSGSIGQDELNDFISEIVGIAKAYKDRVEMKLYCHDTKPYEMYKVENGSIEKIKKIKIVGGGGTSHSLVMEQIAKDSRECKLAVFFTDACSDLQEIDFGKYRYAKLFILNKDGDEEQLKGKQAQVIKLK